MSTRLPSDWLQSAPTAFFASPPATRSKRRWLVLLFFFTLPVLTFWFWRGFVFSLFLWLLLIQEALRLGDSSPPFMDERKRDPTEQGVLRSLLHLIEPEVFVILGGVAFLFPVGHSVQL